MADLVGNARGLVDHARQQQAPIVITEGGRDTAVLLPIELYRQLEQQTVPRIVSPRLVRREDAERFKMELSITESTSKDADARL